MGRWLNVEKRYFGVYATTEDHYQNGGWTWCTTPDGAIQFGKWHAFAGLISPESKAIRIFLDGGLVATCPLSEAGLRRTSQKLVIGANWTGLLDDLRIYGAELSSQEIAELARAK
ncbi:MAG: LamG domain-containing protein [Polyangiaceae bacterium]|nr:LamG domain-containing protein [Polyangiaceae bacterium]